ncbi:MAG TPA: TonB-dependent receptor, partial [Anditalea sp.]|nr:TonB-dependent receptor [Anditalea sp.]
DFDTGETLIGVNVFDSHHQKGSSSNNFGYYSYTTSSGKVELIFSYIGYEPMVFSSIVEKDSTLNVMLRPAHLAEVVVEGSREEVLQERTQMGAVNIPLRQIREMPALFGEVDVLKVLQLLPGVQSGSEGTSGLYVRGGGPDQNLILLDGVPVYNASHLFGFFSVFNADAIKNVELIKGGFPARYGGRLSSVLDISMKDGNMKEFHGEGSIGLIASKLTLEGPIVKDKTSFIVSGRRSYLNLLQLPFINMPGSEGGSTGYYFFDVNAKVNHIINENNRLYLSFYGGEDKGHSTSSNVYTHEDKSTEIEEGTHIGWGNMISALRWNHIFNKKLFANFSGTYTKYHFNLFNELERINKENGEVVDEYFYHADYRSGIRDYALKADFDYIPSSTHYIKFGASHIFHRFSPGVYTTLEKDQEINRPSLSINDSQEYAFYVEDDINLNQKIKINLGLHYSGFIVDDQHYKSLQPRIAARYLLDNNSSIKASYATMTQFVHLLTNAGLGMPTDLWVPATANIGPQESWQTSIGYYKSLPGGLEMSVEGYYKEMDGLLEYK